MPQGQAVFRACEPGRLLSPLDLSYAELGWAANIFNVSCSFRGSYSVGSEGFKGFSPPGYALCSLPPSLVCKVYSGHSVGLYGKGGFLGAVRKAQVHGIPWYVHPY